MLLDSFHVQKRCPAIICLIYIHKAIAVTHKRFRSSLEFFLIGISEEISP
jgi:hypothetical protein